VRVEPATLIVRCRFPTGRGNRVRVVIDEETAGELDRPIRVRPGDRRVRVTSWGLPLCGALSLPCSPGESVELALRVSFPGFALGMVLLVAAMSALAPFAAVLGQHLPGYEFLVLLVTAGGFLAGLVLDFYVLLPALGVFTFRLEA
jgi:hypothetical protein